MVFSADLWAGVEHTTTTFYPVKWMCPLCIEIPVEKKNTVQNRTLVFFSGILPLSQFYLNMKSLLIW
jgi:hypothetical protein